MSNSKIIAMIKVSVISISEKGNHVQLGGPSEDNPRFGEGRWFLINPGATFEIGEIIEISQELWDKGFN